MADEFYFLGDRSMTPDCEYLGEYNVYGLLEGNYENVKFPLQFQKEGKKKLKDLLCTGWAYFHLISEKMKTCLEESEITGWKIFPIYFFDLKTKTEIPGYYGFSVTGRCDKLYSYTSEVITKQHAPEAPIFDCYKGMYFHKDQWDGSDIFKPQETRHVIVTEKAAKSIKKCRLTNVQLKKLSEIEIDTDNAKIEVS